MGAVTLQSVCFFFFFQAEDGIRDLTVTGVQTCALPIFADAEHARSLARRRANAAGPLGEVVGLVQPRQRLAPLPAVDQIVPLGDEVVDRTAGRAAFEQLAGVAERNAAIHATRALLAQRLLGQVVVKLPPVADALLRID